jgi:diadenosine tetraphosphate (Ap4A) HIT family hydrolase
MNATMRKFGFPGSLIKDYDCWSLLLRPQQVTLASLVLAAKSEATAFSSLRPEAFAELGQIVGEIEANLKRFAPYDRINYLMLMMVDPHVHFHVLPRYDKSQSFDGVDYADAGWPGPPDLKSFAATEPKAQAHLLWTLQQLFSGER